MADVEEALRIERATLGPDHPYVAEGEKQLAYLWLDENEVERARRLLTHALSVKEPTGGIHSEAAAEIVLGLARADLASGDFHQATALLERSLGVIETDPASPTWVRAEAQLGLATALWRNRMALDRARSLAAGARRYFRVHDPAGVFLRDTGSFQATEEIR
jgi:eukaryotic-like serine/threonine-protein kinase